MHTCYIYLKNDLSSRGLRSFPQYRDHQMLLILERLYARSVEVIVGENKRNEMDSPSL